MLLYPRISNSQRMLIALKSYVNNLTDLLLSKDILTEQEKSDLNRKAEEMNLGIVNQFYVVDDIDKL